MTQLVTALTTRKFLVHHLANGKSKYMGVCRLPPKHGVTKRLHRRIDLRLVPFNSYACAMLYFTGSDTFNVKMREKAIKMGYTLNEYSLRKKGLVTRISVSCVGLQAVQRDIVGLRGVWLV